MTWWHKWHKKVIGMKQFACWWFPLLKIGLTTAIWKMDGNVPESKHALPGEKVSIARYHSLQSFALMLYMPLHQRSFPRWWLLVQNGAVSKGKFPKASCNGGIKHVWSMVCLCLTSVSLLTGRLQNTQFSAIFHIFNCHFTTAAFLEDNYKTVCDIHH